MLKPFPKQTRATDHPDWLKIDRRAVVSYSVYFRHGAEIMTVLRDERNEILHAILLADDDETIEVWATVGSDPMEHRTLLCTQDALYDALIMRIRDNYSETHRHISSRLDEITVREIVAEYLHDPEEHRRYSEEREMAFWDAA